MQPFGGLGEPHSFWNEHALDEIPGLVEHWSKGGPPFLTFERRLWVVVSED